VVSVTASPRESSHRPSINALFRSAAEAYGRRVAGVLLTGYLYDGVAGLWEVKRRGGVALVQDPREAKHPDLPTNACESVEVDHVLPLSGIAATLLALATSEPRPAPLARSRPARLLIVEDERIVAADLEDEMRALGYEICGNVATADAAVDEARRGLPDLVLMDIRLDASGDGTRAADAIWERLQIPVVYLTAYADEETLDAVKRTEAYGYVMKPYEPREVHAAIQLALERRERETAR
jgi:chemotaxis response regulator CheB